MKHSAQFVDNHTLVQNRWHNLGMRWMFGGVLVLILGTTAIAQDRSQGTVIDLRKYQHVDGTVRPQPQTFIPGFTRAPQAKIVSEPASDVIVVQPRQSIRSVGNLREKMSVVRGEALLGRSEFEISCSIGAAYAQIPGEDVSFRFTRQADCKTILQSTSVTHPCRSRLAINRKTQTIALVGKACDAGPFPSDNDSSIAQERDPTDADEADSLSARARSARMRVRPITK
ncbi:MAG: hypothetical protein U1E10_08355 [Bdellovibrionales bacterium]|nr:hypothetical protein [Bdellovibrionales bacterium]